MPKIVPSPMPDYLVEIFAVEVLHLCRMYRLGVDQLEPVKHRLSALDAERRAPKGADPMLFMKTRIAMIRKTDGEHLAVRQLIGYHQQSLMSFATRISRMFDDTQKFSRQSLRDIAKIDESSPLHDRNVRDYHEHYDNKLEDWFLGSTHKNRVDRTWGGPPNVSGNGVDKYTVGRWSDADTVGFGAKGFQFSIPAVTAEVIRVEAAMEEFLRSGLFRTLPIKTWVTVKAVL